MKRLLIILLMTFNYGYVQNTAPTPIDAALAKLPKMKDDTNKLRTLESITKYYQQTDPDKDIYFGNQGISLAFKLHRAGDICLFYNFLGSGYVNKSDFKMALSLYQKQYALAAANHNKHYMATAYNGLGLVYEFQGDYSQAQNYFFKCLDIAERDTSPHLLNIVTTNISVVYCNQNNYDKTIEYAQRTLRSIKNHKTDEWAIACKNYEMLGSSYVEQKNYVKARVYYTAALNIYQHKKSSIGVATMYSLMMSAYPVDYRKQFDYGLKAQAIWSTLAPKNMYAINNLGNLGIAYGDVVRNNAWQGQDDKLPIETRKKIYLERSREYLTKAIALAKETNSKENIMTFTDSLSVIDGLLGKYKEAFDNLKTHEKIYDTLFSQDSKNKIASLEGKHEIELRDKQLQINKLEIAGQQKQRWFLIGGVVMLVFIALLIYYQSSQRQKTNNTLVKLNGELDEANKIKTKFFGILNHDLRSPIASFIHFLHLQQNEPDMVNAANEEKYSKKIAESAENLLDTMEELLLWSKGQMENFNPKIQQLPVAELFIYIEKSFNESGIAITFDQPQNMTLDTDEHYIKTIMQNLTGNAVKALAQISSPAIQWRAWEQDGIKYLSIADNGPGVNDDQLKPLYDPSAPIGIKSGFGLHIVRDLAKAIKCKISTAANKKGVTIQIAFPAA